MKKWLVLFVTFLAFPFLIVAASWAAVPAKLPAPAPVPLQPLENTVPAKLPAPVPVPLKKPPEPLPTPDSKTSFIGQSDFNSVISTGFKGAYFEANSCGGDSGGRKTSIYMPNLLGPREEGMDRLEYNLTSGQMDRTRTGPPGPIGGRRKTAIRACFLNWRSDEWLGSVENGKFTVILVMQTGTADVANRYKVAVIEGRAMTQVQLPPPTNWGDMYKWGDQEVNDSLADYIFRYLRFKVVLTPVVSNGQISYGNVDAMWICDQQNFDAAPTMGFDGMITNYKDKWLEILRTRLIVALGDPNVKAKLSEKITEMFRAKHRAAGPINIITGVIGAGNTVTVQHN